MNPSHLAEDLPLKQAVVELQQEGGMLKPSLASGAFATTIHSLGVDGITVLRPITVTVRRDGDEYIASFYDANISTGGCSEQQAISNLQSLIADIFLMHCHSADELGPAMTSQRTVLMESLCRTSQKTLPSQSSRS